MAQTTCTICSKNFKSWHARNAHMQVHKYDLTHTPSKRKSSSPARSRVETILRKERGATIRARIPALVRQQLGAGEGDRIIFERGCERVVTIAALKGPYFIVRMEPGAESYQRHEQKVDREAASTSSYKAAHKVSAPADSISEQVKRKLDERGRTT